MCMACSHGSMVCKNSQIGLGTGKLHLIQSLRHGLLVVIRWMVNCRQISVKFLRL